MAKCLTKAEFYDKYGDVQVKFNPVGKYKFTYTAALPDGQLLTVGYGVNAEEIRRSGSWVPHLWMFVQDFQPSVGLVHDGLLLVAEYYAQYNLKP